MTPTTRALALRLVACPAWEWRAGMLGVTPGTVTVRCVVGGTSDDPPWGCDNAGNEWPMGEEQDLLPDLDDAATVGCVLAIVREAHGEPTLHLTPDTRDAYDTAEPYVVWFIHRLDAGETEWLRLDGAWGCGNAESAPPIETLTEAEALVAALESLTHTED